MEFEKVTTINPRERAENIKDIISSLKSLCRSEIHLFSEPKAKALLETSADVLGGLEKAFQEFVNKDEAWKEEPDEHLQKSSDPWD
jgi:HD-like signal output (HDOD) protein